MSHLDEIKTLVAECMARTIDLLPDGEVMPPAADARESGVQLLHNLRSIQREVDLAAAGAP